MILCLPSLRFAALCAVGLVTLSAAAVATTTRPTREMRCDMMEEERGRLTTIEAPGLHVLDQTAQAGPFSPTIPAGIAGIMCARTSILPAMHDDEVIVLGLPLYIAEIGGRRRLGVLEIDNGQYRFRMLEGRLQAEEEPALQQRLSEFQARFPAAPAR